MKRIELFWNILYYCTYTLLYSCFCAIDPHRLIDNKYTRKFYKKENIFWQVLDYMKRTEDTINHPHCYVSPVIPYLYCLFISSILSGISITMFLNCFAIIRNNSLYSFFSFFLAHILIMLYVYIESEYKIVSTLNLYTIPFMVILLCLYIIFRKKVQLTSTCATSRRQAVTH